MCSDYNTPATCITILAGKQLALQTLTATADEIIEASETVIVDITSVSGGSASESGAQQQTVTITDDDIVAVTLSISDISITEAGSSNITASLDKVTFEDVHVNLTYTGTATPGADYQIPKNKITIAAGQTTGSITLITINDSTEEADETIIIDIASVSGGGSEEVTT